MDEALRKVLTQLQAQHQEASRQLSIAKQQANGRERDKRATTLTLREIEALPRSGPTAPAVYRGVGRMFMQESRNSVENTLKAKEKELTEELAVLAKKVKVPCPIGVRTENETDLKIAYPQYLESEINTAQGSLRDVLQEHQR